VPASAWRLQSPRPRLRSTIRKPVASLVVGFTGLWRGQTSHDRNHRLSALASERTVRKQAGAGDHEISRFPSKARRNMPCLRPPALGARRDRAIRCLPSAERRRHPDAGTFADQWWPMRSPSTLRQYPAGILRMTRVDAVSRLSNRDGLDPSTTAGLRRTPLYPKKRTQVGQSRQVRFVPIKECVHGTDDRLWLKG